MAARTTQTLLVSKRCKEFNSTCRELHAEIFDRFGVLPLSFLFPRVRHGNLRLRIDWHFVNLVNLPRAGCDELQPDSYEFGGGPFFSPVLYVSW